MRVSTSRVPSPGLLGPLVLLATLCCACGGPKAPDPRYPSRPERCDVKLFHESPSMKTDNIGPVMATCSSDLPDADCLRQLMDESCKLGGDVVWGVPDKPTQDGGKNLWFGRAAHTKTAAPASPAPSGPPPASSAAPAP